MFFNFSADSKKINFRRFNTTWDHVKDVRIKQLIKLNQELASFWDKFSNMTVWDWKNRLKKAYCEIIYDGVCEQNETDKIEMPSLVEVCLHIIHYLLYVKVL
jgi:hypothetical protein